MDSSKLTADVLRGRELRKEVEKHINMAAKMAGSLVRIEPIHKDFRFMTASEKARFNTQRNRESDQDPERAMGLDYHIYSIYDIGTKDVGKKKQIVLQIRFSDSAGYYIKIPSDRRMDPEAYLEEIADHTFILFVLKVDGQVKKEYSGITPLRKMLNLPHEMSTAKGNEGRMIFHYELSKIQYYPLTQNRGFFTTSTLRQLEDVLISFT